LDILYFRRNNYSFSNNVDKPILKRENRIGIKGKKLPLPQFCHIVNYVSVLGPTPSEIHKNLINFSIDNLPQTSYIVIKMKGTK